MWMRLVLQMDLLLLFEEGLKLPTKLLRNASVSCSVKISDIFRQAKVGIFKWVHSGYVDRSELTAPLSWSSKFLSSKLWFSLYCPENLSSFQELTYQ